MKNCSHMTDPQPKKEVRHRKEVRRDIQKVFRVTQAESDQLDAASEPYKDGLSGFIRERCLGQKVDRTAATAEDKVLLNISDAFRVIADNVKRIAQKPLTPQSERDLNDMRHAISTLGIHLIEHIHKK